MYENDARFQRVVNMADSTIRKLYEGPSMKPLSERSTRELSIMLTDLKALSRAIEDEMNDRIERMGQWS